MNRLAAAAGRLPALASPPVAALTLAMLAAALPHFLRVPAWVAIMFLAQLAWRLALPAPPRAPRPPNALLRLVIGIAIVSGVYTTYGTLTGRDAGVALLILLAAMKLVEIRQRRDLFVAAFIGLFLLLTNFFYIQSMASAAYLALGVLLFLHAFISFNDHRGETLSASRLRLAAAMLLQAVPLMLVLFVLFPRVNGPLWGLPRDARAAGSGLDDQMAPGSISQLSLSDEVAFRVEFEDGIPERRNLYWRGPVLWFTDGFRWVPDRARQSDTRVETRGKGIDYTLTMEPTGKNWIYALELPGAIPPRSLLTHDQQLRTRGPLDRRVRYTLTAFPDHVIRGTAPDELQRALQLPPGRHARARSLASGWQAQGLGPRAIVNRALSTFNSEPFYYTLTPPLLLQDPVDQFLFETRQGFCEHYAAAFVVLMRAAGVPARVVTGYQGGTVNPVGGYLVVRQRDAHAWAEVWLPDLGWVRVDPTAAVAPSRIQQGIDTALPGGLIDIPLGLQDSAIARDLWQRLGFSWDALNNRWNQWVLGYDENRQSLLLSRVGLGGLDRAGLVWALTVAVALAMLAIAAWLFRRAMAAGDPARRCFDRFCRKLSRAGLRRHPAEGPQAFGRRAALRFHAQAGDIGRITDLYIAVRYGCRGEDLPALEHAVRAFRPAGPGGRQAA